MYTRHESDTSHTFHLGNRWQVVSLTLCLSLTPGKEPMVPSNVPVRIQSPVGYLNDMTEQQWFPLTSEQSVQITAIPCEDPLSSTGQEPAQILFQQLQKFCS
jgi:hypothetical protein